MQITQEQKQRMEEIMADMPAHGINCRRNFQCYRSSLENLCKVEGIGAFDTIECDAKDASCCGLSFAAAGKRYCKCPMRRYIAGHFRR